MKLFRKILFWCHLAAGLTAAIVVVVMSATGVLLTYQKQVTAWADRRAVHATAPAANAVPLSVEELVRRASSAAGGETPTTITLRSRADAPAEVAFGRERRVFVDAYTGAVLGDGSATVRGFFRVVTAWHRTLGGTAEHRALGKAITGAANLLFLFLVVSGAYLWWPRTLTRASFRNITRFRRGLSGKARDFNWHNVIGVWSVVPLVVIVGSGVVMSYRWANDLVYRVAGESPPAQAARASAAASAAAAPYGGLDALVARAGERVPDWTSVVVTLPTAAAKTVSLSLDRGTGGQPQLRSQLVLDRGTGRELRWDRFGAQTPGRRLRSILRFAHTGEVLGIPGQTIAGLASLGAVVLACTGIALAIRRLAARRRRTTAFARDAAAAPVVDAAA
jgi:uncharacterized iron-regulated membrane protein